MVPDLLLIKIQQVYCTVRVGHCPKMAAVRVLYCWAVGMEKVFDLGMVTSFVRKNVDHLVEFSPPS